MLAASPSPPSLAGTKHARDAGVVVPCGSCSAPNPKDFGYCNACGISSVAKAPTLGTTCTTCETPLPDGAKFCGGCGSASPAPAGPPATCVACNVVVPSTAKFCLQCGKPQHVVCPPPCGVVLTGAFCSACGKQAPGPSPSAPLQGTVHSRHAHHTPGLKGAADTAALAEMDARAWQNVNVKIVHKYQALNPKVRKLYAEGKFLPLCGLNKLSVLSSLSRFPTESSQQMFFSKTADGHDIFASHAPPKLTPITSWQDLFEALETLHELDLHLRPARLRANTNDRATMKNLRDYVEFEDAYSWYELQSKLAANAYELTGQYNGVGTPDHQSYALWLAKFTKRPQPTSSAAPSSPLATPPSHKTLKLPHATYLACISKNLCLNWQRGTCEMPPPHQHIRRTDPNIPPTPTTVHHACAKCGSPAHGSEAKVC